MALTDNQLRVLENIISMVIGAGSGLGLQWLKTRKPESEQQNEYLNTIAKASGENINAAQQVTEMLKEMLKDQSEVFARKIEDAKESCTLEINKLKEEYGEKIEALKADNEALHIKAERLTKENVAMSIELAKLRTDRDYQTRKLDSFKERLSKYESVTTDKIKPIKGNASDNAEISE